MSGQTSTVPGLRCVSGSFVPPCDDAELGQNVWFIKDVKSAGTNGGTFTSGAWQTRDLTVLEKPASASNEVTLASNQITIGEGIYQVWAKAPARNVTGHKTRFQNITDGVTEIVGTSESTLIGAFSNSSSFIYGLIEVSSPTVYEVQHQAQSTSAATTGFGGATGFATDEVYTMVVIEKIG